MAETQASAANAAAVKPGNVLDSVIEATDLLSVRASKMWGIKPSNIYTYVRTQIGLWREAPDGYKVPEPVVDQFLSVCMEHGLNPAKKEAYGFYHPDKGLQCGVMIDGWITLANRQQMFDGWELTHERNASGVLESVTCHLYRKDRSRPIVVRVKRTEWYIGSSPNWRDRPEWMLEIKAIKQAIRLGFGFGGLQDDDDIAKIIDETERRGAKAAEAGHPPAPSLSHLKPAAPPPEDEYSSAKPPRVVNSSPAGGPEPAPPAPAMGDKAPPTAAVSQPDDKAASELEVAPPRETVGFLLAVALDEAGFTRRGDAAKVMGCLAKDVIAMINDHAKPTATQLDKLEQANVDVRKLREILGMVPAATGAGKDKQRLD